MAHKDPCYTGQKWPISNEKAWMEVLTSGKCG